MNFQIRGISSRQQALVWSVQNQIAINAQTFVSIVVPNAAKLSRTSLELSQLMSMLGLETEAAMDRRSILNPQSIKSVCWSPLHSSKLYGGCLLLLLTENSHTLVLQPTLGCPSASEWQIVLHVTPTGIDEHCSGPTEARTTCASWSPLCMASAHLSLIALGAQTGSIVLLQWDPQETCDKFIAVNAKHDSPVSLLHFSSSVDGVMLLASAALDGSVMLHRIILGAFNEVGLSIASSASLLAPDQRNATCLAFNPTATILAVGLGCHLVLLSTDTAKNCILDDLPTRTNITELAWASEDSVNVFCSDGKWFVVNVYLEDGICASLGLELSFFIDECIQSNTPTATYKQDEEPLDSGLVSDRRTRLLGVSQSFCNSLLAMAYLSDPKTAMTYRTEQTASSNFLLCPSSDQASMLGQDGWLKNLLLNLMKSDFITATPSFVLFGVLSTIMRSQSVSMVIECVAMIDSLSSKTHIYASQGTGQLDNRLLTSSAAVLSRIKYFLLTKTKSMWFDSEYRDALDTELQTAFGDILKDHIACVIISAEKQIFNGTISQNDISLLSAIAQTIYELKDTVVTSCFKAIFRGHDNFHFTKGVLSIVSGSNKYVDKCSICGLDVTGSMMAVASCSNGHFWERCSLSFMLIDNPDTMSCSGCERKKIKSSFDTENRLSTLILDKMQCIYCGDRYYATVDVA